MNRELEEKGFTVINGKVSRKYFEEQFYGMAEGRTMEVKNGSV